MTSRLVASVAVLIVGGAVSVAAHVVVLPRESIAGAEEQYTVRVPTEGDVATVSVELEIPDGVRVTDVPESVRYTFQLARDSNRVVSITWTQTIAPGQRAEFVFGAQNPDSGEVVWKAHQRFADGTASHWVGAGDDARPASVTNLRPSPTRR